jgi:hypothetical protein
MPIAFGEKFHLNPQQIGLQFLGLIIGSVLGEQISGPVSDLMQRRRERQLHARGIQRYVSPTPRLWFSYLGFVTVIVGILIWGVRIAQATEGKWNVTPLVGAGIAAFGNQIVTTTLITFAVDCHRSRAGDIGVLVNLIRQVWGFISPFYLPDMFVTLGFSGSAGLMSGVVVLFSWLPVALLHFQHSRQNKEELKEVVQ